MKSSRNVSCQTLRYVVDEDEKKSRGDYSSLGDSFPDWDGVAQACIKLDSGGSVAEETFDPIEHVVAYIALQ